MTTGTIEGTHIYRSAFQSDTLLRMWGANLAAYPLGREQLLEAEGIKLAVYKGLLRAKMACPVCGLEAPTADEQRWTLHLTPNAIYPHRPGLYGCEMGQHAPFGVEKMIDLLAPSKPKKRALLKKHLYARPQLERFYSAEADAGYHYTSRDAQDAVNQALGPVHDCTIKLVAIEAPSLDIAHQLAGQLHSELPWADVELEKDGTIKNPAWHGGHLLEWERRRIENRKDRAKFAELKAQEQRQLMGIE